MGRQSRWGLLVVSQMPGPDLESSVLERPLTHCPEEQQGWGGIPDLPLRAPLEAPSPGGCGLVSSTSLWTLVWGFWASEASPSLSSTPRYLGLTSYCLGSLVLNSFYFLAEPCCMQDLSSLTRNQTHIPCSGSSES